VKRAGYKGIDTGCFHFVKSKPRQDSAEINAKAKINMGMIYTSQKESGGVGWSGRDRT
jgi:hypothetical protein